jgi:hypothetical protein
MGRHRLVPCYAGSGRFVSPFAALVTAVVVAMVGTPVATPPTAFFAVGCVCWPLTYWRVVVDGDTSVPKEIGMSVQEYLVDTFVVCGFYGAMFVVTGFSLSLPLIILWRITHSSSFKRFTRS